MKTEEKKVMGKASLLTEDEKKKILKLLKEKKSATEVARIVKRSHYAVWRIAKKNGVELGNRLSKEETAKILKLLKEKKNGAEVAMLVKRSKSPILRIAKENGIKLGKTGPKPKK